MLREAWLATGLMKVHAPRASHEPQAGGGAAEMRRHKTRSTGLRRRTLPPTAPASYTRRLRRLRVLSGAVIDAPAERVDLFHDRVMYPPFERAPTRRHPAPRRRHPAPTRRSNAQPRVGPRLGPYPLLYTRVQHCTPNVARGLAGHGVDESARSTRVTRAASGGGRSGDAPPQNPFHGLKAADAAPHRPRLIHKAASPPPRIVGSGD